MAGIDAKLQQRLKEKGLIGDDSFQRLNQTIAQDRQYRSDIAALPKAEVVDKTGFIPGTNVRPESRMTARGQAPSAVDQLKRSTPDVLDIPDQQNVEQQGVASSAERLASMYPGVSLGGYLKALGQQAETNAKVADEAAALMEQQKQRAFEEQQRIKQEREQDQQYLDQQRQVVQQRIDQFNESPANIGQLFAEKKTGGKIVTALALFLGSAPNSSGQNSAVKVMQDAINADLDKQVQGIEGEQGIYNTLRQELGDKDQARAAAYEMVLDQMSRELDLQAAQYKGQQIQDNLAAAQEKIKYEKNLAQQAQMAKMIEKMQENKMKQRDLLVPGLGFALTKEDASALKESGATHYQAIDQINRLIELGKEKGSSISPEARSEAVKLQKALIGMLRVPITGPGAMNESELKLLESLVANPTSLWNKSTGLGVKKLEQLSDMLETSRNATVRAYGLQTPTRIEDIAVEK